MIGYRRSAALPGVEVVDSYDSPRKWSAICDTFGVTFFRAWSGEVSYRGRQRTVVPGFAFCNYPNEPMVAIPRPESIGSFNTLTVHPDLIREWAAECGACGPRAEWKAIFFPNVSPELNEKFHRLSASLSPEATALQLQSEAAELAEALVRDLIAGGADQTPSESPAIRGTARMRECLHGEDFDLDLETLAKTAGLSKFQALRAFKRRYGLPPHAYQLCLRINRARLMLLDGASPVEAATQLGFVDQSHMSRHFKRIVGVTPKRYLLCGSASKPRAAESSAAAFARTAQSLADRSARTGFNKRTR